MIKDFLALEPEEKVTFINDYLVKLVSEKGNVAANAGGDEANDFIMNGIKETYAAELGAMSFDALKQLQKEMQKIDIPPKSGQKYYNAVAFCMSLGAVVDEFADNKLILNTESAALRHHMTPIRDTEKLEGVLLKEEKMVLDTIKQLEEYRKISNKFYDSNTEQKNQIVDKLLVKLRSDDTPFNKISFVHDELKEENTVAILSSNPETKWLLLNIINSIVAYLNDFTPTKTTSISQDMKNQIDDDVKNIFGQS